MTDWYAHLLDDVVSSPDPADRALLLAELGGATIMLEGGAEATIDLLRRAVESAGGEVEPYVGMLLGLALHARFRAEGSPADLEAGTTALESSLSKVPVTMPWRCFAAADLVNGLRLAVDSDGAAAGNRHDPLNRAVERGEDELAHYRDRHSEAAPLLVNLALAYADRWLVAREVEDASRAIHYWRTYFDGGGPATPDDARFAGELGGILVDRAYWRGDPADAREAVAVLAAIVESAGEAPPQTWYQLGRAYQAQWELGGSADCLRAAFDWYRDALHHELSDELALDGSQRLASVAAFMYIADKGQLDRGDVRRLVAGSRERLVAATTVASATRARVAVTLAVIDAFLLSPDRGDEDSRRVHDLLGHARDADLEPRFRGMALIVREHVASWTARARPGHLDGDALTLLLTGGRFPPAREAEIADVVAAMLLDRSRLHGDRRGTDAAVRMMRESADRRAAEDVRSAIDATVIDALHHALRGDMTAFTEEMRRAAELCVTPGGLSPDPDLVISVGFLEQLAEAVGTSAAPPDLGPLPTGTPAGPEAVRSRLIQLRVTLLRARATGDLDVLRQIADGATSLLLDDALDLGGQRYSTLGIAADADLEVAGRDPHDGHAARRAVDRYEELCRLAGGPRHPDWAWMARGLARGLRLTGDPDDRAVSRAVGRSALSAQAWQVMLQSGTDYAVRAADATLGLVGEVAAWCAEDHRSDPAALEDLIAVLELGRGQVLRAATVSRSIADQLADAGHLALAAEWRATAEPPAAGSAATGLAAVPDALRLRVMDALHPDGPDRSTLQPPLGVSGIRAALRHSDTDVLVYLLEGAAVIVSTADDAQLLELPDLRSDLVVTLHRMLAAYGAGRDLGPAAPHQDSPVELMCEWAWYAAVQPLLSRIARLVSTRPPRVALVPTGPFGIVPWHAAFVDTGAGRWYLVDDVVVSYAVSATMFCASARHPLRRPQATLIVGDATGNLPFAGLEARAVHEVFHPHGTCLERATPDEVVRWFADRDTAPAAAHFACHGRLDPAHPADAELVLAGGTLSVRRLIAASRHRELYLDQVFLAACSTKVAGDRHDEAVSIGSTFMAAGARTVFSSLWTVPDAATALLMFMLHFYLSVEGLPPADALRAAQLWMLDPARERPAGMPDALAGQMSAVDCADPAAWAAFVHMGR